MFTNITSTENLLKYLLKINISVPGRSEGRKTKDTEKYSICRLLSTLSETHYLQYPISLIKRERPDYQLNCNETNIGIEVTQATNQDYSEFLTYAAHVSPKHTIEPSHFRHNKRITKNEKNKLIEQERLTARPWIGDDVEKEWSLYIQDAIQSKSAASNKVGFEKFEKNWLLIYDNTPCSFLDKNLLLPYIENFKFNYNPKYFDNIFIETQWTEEEKCISEGIIISINNHSIKYFLIKDLWKKQ